MCPACLMLLYKATGPDEVRVTNANHLNAIEVACANLGIIRSAVTRYVLVALSSSPLHFCCPTNGLNFRFLFTPEGVR